MATMTLTDANFQEAIQADKPVLVDFWAAWCGPCRMMAPVLEEFAESHADKVTVAKLNVDENPEITSQFGIMSIPTLILFKGGQPVKQLIGYQPKEQLEAQLADVLQ
ncbi:thioredoxin [Alicyclobacillus mali]|uniref:Thioredoxin n=1 Tax=Alicyclobacillus mali (ex Roth et al. 2021) TaxID=1123961 RepID=A0ABS0F346_9BACL|nr:thioredoxin [Alicyclobacillus mali (ex Roth et al. 2021)]MBF8377702.1 thioredoxin [Alicyclobacillus mali (ex Roth et al. 2021)]MCL6489922.1 thioredoxin [Alicyclobacillus mali (ex Roth et al. 2021)]